MLKRTLLITSLLASSVAGAKPLADDDMYVVEPSRTADRAQFKPGRIAWCAPGPWKGEVWDYHRLRRATQSAIRAIEGATKGTRMGSGPTLEALEHLCQWPDDRGWQKQVTYLYQAVMNSQGVTQDEAVEIVKTWIRQGQEARERESRPPTDEERFAFSEHQLTPIKPEYAIDTAKITGAIPWCDKAAGVDKDRWDTGRISRTIDAPYGISGTIEGAYHLCQRPNDTTWKQKATYVLQKWMNWTGQPQSEAIQSIRARIQTEKMKRESAALCKALELGPEVGGQAKSYGEARRRFFGCSKDGEELWRNPQVPLDDDVAFWLDADSEFDSEIVRMYWLFGQTDRPDLEKHGGNSAFDNRALLTYAVASVDFAKLDWKAIEKELAAPPYSGNEYARAVASESFHMLRLHRKLFEEAIDKLAKQAAEYNTILREAPKKGFAQWEKVTAPWKAELARSLAFEKKLSNPSRKALQGCSKELMPDVQKLIKSYKKNEYGELVKALANDPIASLLLSRFAVCLAAEKVVGSGAFRDIVEQGRAFRGPRTMAYFAIVDALTEALEDRPKLVLSHSNFWFRGQRALTDVYRSELTFTGNAPRNPKDTYAKGFVKEVKKSGDGVTVVFKTQKFKYREYDCVPTNRPIRIRADGGIEYEQNCRATGRMLSQDATPAPVTISPLLATGVKPGAYVVAHNNVIVYVAKKPDDTKLQTFFGFTP